MEDGKHSYFYLYYLYYLYYLLKLAIHSEANITHLFDGGANEPKKERKKEIDTC